MSAWPEDLLKRRSLAKNMALNLLGQLIPIFAAIFSIPILISALGADQFGVLALAWMVVGYFGLLDLGVGRALTKMVAEAIGKGETAEVPTLIRTALMLAVAVGIIGAALLTATSSLLVNILFEMPIGLRAEAEQSFIFLALCIPAILASSALSGVLQAYQRFDLVNLVRAPIGTLTFAAPAVTALITPNLGKVVATLVFVKLVEGLLNCIFCRRVIPGVTHRLTIEREYISEILAFGGWISLSNVISPLLLYLDRVLIGSLISVRSVAYYSGAYEVVNRLMVIPGAIVGVLFPAFGVLMQSSHEDAQRLFLSGVKYTLVIMVPIALFIVLFAREILTLWLGQEFAGAGATVLKILMIGSLASSVSYFPFAVLHAAGRADLTAKLHIVEAIIYAMISWPLIGSNGIVGAAIAWTARAFFDALGLFYLAGRVLRLNYPVLNIIQSVIILAVFLGILFLVDYGLYFKFLMLLFFLPGLFAMAWWLLLNKYEKVAIRTTVFRFVSDSSD
jgi:O-antigen/teichoic acid export membrane protein